MSVPSRALFQGEVRNFNQAVDAFSRRYSTPALVGVESQDVVTRTLFWPQVDRLLKDTRELNCRKVSLFDKCQNLSWPKEDCKKIENQLFSSQEKIDRVLCKFYVKCSSPDYSNKIESQCSFDFDILQVSGFQYKYEQLEKATSKLLEFPVFLGSTEEKERLHSEWTSFREQINALNKKTGDYLFKNRHLYFSSKDPAVNNRYFGILDAEVARISLWTHADYQILQLQGYDLPNKSA